MAESAKRLLRLINCVAVSERGIGLIDVARLAKVDKTTAVRLLSAAQDEGWIWRHPESKVYEPGPELLRIANVVGLPHGVDQLIGSSLRRLRDLTGETATFQAVVGQSRVCLAGVESHQQLKTGIPKEEVLPLERGLVGLSLLAFSPEPFRRHVLRALDATLATKLTGDVREIRSRGFCQGESDRTPGVSAAVVPVLASGNLLGVLALTGPSNRFNVEARTEAVENLLHERDTLSALIATRDKTQRSG